MRKLVYSTLALGAAFAFSFGINATDASATVVTVNSSTNADKLVLSVPDDGEGVPTVKQVLVGTAKVKKNTLVASTWDVYQVEGTTVDVDLSKLAKTKDQYLLVKADFESDQDAAGIKIPASPKISAKYNKLTGKLEVFDASAKTKNDPYDGGVVEYATESSDIKVALGEDASANAGWDVPETFKNMGAVLYLTTAQVPAPESYAISALPIDAENNFVIAGTEDTPLEGYVLNPRISKAAKVSIGKLANAPKVTANYTKGTVTIPKGVDYRIFYEDDGEVPEMFAEEAKKNGQKAATYEVGSAEGDSVIVAATLDEDSGEYTTRKFAVDVQKAGSEKSAASKIGHYAFDGIKVTDAEEVAKIKADIVTKKEVTTLTLENKSSLTYNVSYKPIGAKAVKTSKLAPNKKLKISKFDISETGKISYQVVGDKVTGTWPTIPKTDTNVIAEEGSDIQSGIEYSYKNEDAEEDGGDGDEKAQSKITSIEANFKCYIGSDEVTVNSTNIEEGTEVTIKYSPASSSTKLDKATTLKITGADGTQIGTVEFAKNATSGTSNTFNMPAQNVSIAK